MKKIIKKYNYAVIASDVIIFTVKDEQLQVLLIKMRKFPYENFWAAPGGLVKGDESVDSAAERLLYEKTGLKNIYLEQLHTFGDVKRDPFGRVVSVTYFALIPDINLKLKTTKDYQDIQFFPLKNLPKLAYDHEEMIEMATIKLRRRLENTNIVYNLLPHDFTLSQLQKNYEIILDKPLDKRNFRKKILSTNLLKKNNKKIVGKKHRPADLYSFAQLKYQII